jgi:hypothetical protein
LLWNGSDRARRAGAGIKRRPRCRHGSEPAFTRSFGECAFDTPFALRSQLLNASEEVK